MGEIMGRLTAFARDVYPSAAFPNFPPPRGPAGAESFSIQTARALIWAAQLAYETDDSEKHASILTDWGWSLQAAILKRFSSVLPQTGTKAFVAACGETIIVSFAGTEPDSLANWIMDLSVHRTADGLHEGFLNGVDAAWPEISTLLHGNNTRPVYFCGHSLGAAMAALAAYRYLKEDPGQADRVRAVYTIGMPRSGNALFADNYNTALGNRTFRMVHGEDIVSTVPPNSAPFNFRHVGLELRCPRRGKMNPAGLATSPTSELPLPPSEIGDLLAAVLSPPDAGANPFPSANFGVKPLIALLAGPVRDHLADQYLRALDALNS
jgi:hypothetical protein